MSGFGNLTGFNVTRNLKKMEKTYNPHAIEQHWYNTWEEKGYFTPQGEGKPFQNNKLSL